MSAHLAFRRAIRGAILADQAFDPGREHVVGWDEVRESWVRLQRNNRPTPWDGLVGRASTRYGDGLRVEGVQELSSPIETRTQSDATGGLLDPTAVLMTRVRIDDTQYYYSLSAGVVTPPHNIERGFTWTYAGQAVHTTAPRRGEGRWYRPQREDHRDTDNFIAGASIRIDPLDRVWLLSAVDDNLIAQARGWYDRRVASLFGKSESANNQRWNEGQVRPDGNHDTELFIFPEWWTWRFCGVVPVPRATPSVSESTVDPLEFSDLPLNERAGKVVYVSTDRGVCSGTMIDDRHILTAAHCIVDDDGRTVNKMSTQVCTYGNLPSAAPSGRVSGCYSVGWLHPLVGYVPGEFGRDAAILTLNTPLTGAQQVGWMPLSAREDLYSGHDDIVRGYPGFIGNCVSSTAGSGVHQSHARGQAIDGDSQRLMYETSHAEGQSGGAHYYCPSGDCSEGHFLTSVHAVGARGFALSGAVWMDGSGLIWGAYSGIGGYSGGCRASFLRDWVAGYTFNYL